MSIRIELTDSDTAAHILAALRGEDPSPEDQRQRQQIAAELSRALVTRLIGATRHPAPEGTAR